MFPSNQYIPYKLKEINLSYNLMPVLTSDLTVGTGKAEILNISHNAISDIRKGKKHVFILRTYFLVIAGHGYHTLFFFSNTILSILFFCGPYSTSVRFFPSTSLSHPVCFLSIRDRQSFLWSTHNYHRHCC